MRGFLRGLPPSSSRSLSTGILRNASLQTSSCTAVLESRHGKCAAPVASRRGFASFTPPEDNIEGAFMGMLVGNCFGGTVDGEALPGECLDVYHVENLFTAETLQKSMIKRFAPLFSYTDHYLFTKTLSDLVLDHGFDIALDKAALAHAFLGAWHEESHRKVSPGLTQQLERMKESVDDPDAPLSKIRRLQTSGGPARVLPLAIAAPSVEKLDEAVAITTEVTHGHKMAVRAAQLQARALYAVLRGQDVWEAVLEDGGASTLQRRLAELKEIADAPGVGMLDAAMMMNRKVSVDGRAGVTVPCAISSFARVQKRFETKEGILKYQRQEVIHITKGTLSNIGATHRLQPEGGNIYVQRIDPPEVLT